ncbi:RCKP-type rubredoxin-like domain-containing protein [Phosphitispora fastidiosa]|nr:rubrerythrin [Phosphitispora fastidiosa]
MAVFVCANCGFTKETRCKPKKCPECGSNDSFAKKEENNK